MTKADVDCLFYSNTLVAQAAGVAPPTEADKDRFIRDLPSQFGSLSKVQQEALMRAELRVVSVNDVYTGTIKTRAAMIVDIKRNVHSSADVPTVARQIENDTEHDGKYWQSYLNEGFVAILQAQRFANGLGLEGQAGRNVMRMSRLPSYFPNGQPIPGAK